MVSNDVCGDGVTMEAVSDSLVYRPGMTLGFKTLALHYPVITLPSTLSKVVKYVVLVL